MVALLASALGVLTTAADMGDISPAVNVLNGALRFVLDESGALALHPDVTDWELRDWPDEVVGRFNPGAA